ncbi:MAG: carbohydrate-binding family 9-like protein, partial [Gemmataceae bacterium]|nr:carbohydrate-binding family 9-like protein [Gemmataceae bacterium]
MVGVASVSRSNADQRPVHPIPAALKEAPSASFECRWVDSPITLDGLADEPAWKHAQSITAFHVPWLGDKARMSRTATTAKLLWDRDYLYFHADMEDSDLFADITEHDGDLWKNDVFELFLRPDPAKTGYYEFQVNAAGATFDAFYPKYDLDQIAKQSKIGTFAFEAKVKLRGTLNKRDDADKGWSVEGRVPWTDFLRTGGRPVPGETWKLNLCRFDYNADWKEPELSCIAPIAKKKIPPFFHQTEDYATLTFVGPDDTTA